MNKDVYIINMTHTCKSWGNWHMSYNIETSKTLHNNLKLECVAMPSVIDGRPLGWSKFWSYFSPSVETEVHQITKLSMQVGKWSQRRFPFEAILLHSGDIRGQVAKSPKFECFWTYRFWRRSCKNVWQNVINLGHLERVAKFGDDRPSNLGD